MGTAGLRSSFFVSQPSQGWLQARRADIHPETYLHVRLHPSGASRPTVRTIAQYPFAVDIGELRPTRLAPSRRRAFPAEVRNNPPRPSSRETLSHSSGFLTRYDKEAFVAQLTGKGRAVGASASVSRNADVHAPIASARDRDCCCRGYFLFQELSASRIQHGAEANRSHLTKLQLPRPKLPRCACRPL